MSDEINFVDLLALSKIGPDTVVEKFGGLINSSFFDASNILGTLKIKGLIDFVTAFPGQSAITITDLGKNTMAEANSKVNAPFDSLDFATLTQLSSGKRSLSDLGSAINIRPRDLAMHLYKLMQNQYLTAGFMNGVIDIALTEKGFLQVKAGMPTPQTQQAQAAGAAPAAQAMPSAPTTAPGETQYVEQAASTSAKTAPGQQAPLQQQPAAPDNEIHKIIAEDQKRRSRRNFTLALVIVVIIIVIALALKYIK